MNEQKLSLTAGIVYALAAAAVIFLFTVCGSGSSAVTVQTSEQGYKGQITIEVSVAGTKIKSAKLVAIAAINDKAVLNFKAKKIKLKSTIKIQKQAIFTKNKISFRLGPTGASGV